MPIIYQHTKECLIKDQWDIETDPTWVYLREQLEANREFKLEKSLGSDARADQRELWAAMAQAAAGNLPSISPEDINSAPLNSIIDAYRTAIKDAAPQESAINFRPLDRYLAVKETHYRP